MLYHNWSALIALAVAAVVAVRQSLDETPRPRRRDRWEADENEPVTRRPVARQESLLWAAGLLMAGLILLATAANASASGPCGGC
jgi:hypothetical protein